MNINRKTIECVPDDNTKVTRMDFTKVASGWIVAKFIERGPRAFPAQEPGTLKPNPNFDIEKALAWCEANGWTVHRGDYWARAWLGEARPVRTAEQIRRMRNRLENDARYDARCTDLAFDNA